MCNKAAADFVRAHLGKEEVAGRSVLEVGACNVNGSVRPAVEALGPAAYVGVDIVPGPGVDRFCGINDLVKVFGAGVFDVVVCTEVLEHVRDWRGALSNLKNVLKPGGVLLVTTRSPGFSYHGWPHDFWRYDSGDALALFSDFELEAALPDQSAPGVFLKARRPAAFREKDLSGYALYSVLKASRVRQVGLFDVALFMLKTPSVSIFPKIRKKALALAARVKSKGSSHAEAAGKGEACGFCGGRDFAFIFSGRDYLAASPEIFNVARCSSCLVVSMNPRPGDILPYYEPYRKGSPDGGFVKLLSPDRVRSISELKPPGRALDIGCGRGGILAGLKAVGWEVYGCDTSRDACDWAVREAGLENIRNCSGEDLDLPEGSFDVITFWHSLEHLERPRQALEKAVRLLKDDGVLVIESPDFSSLQARFFKDRWFMLDLPRHQYQFEPESLTERLAAAGLSVCKWDWPVNPAGTYVSFKKSLLRYLGLERPAGKSRAAQPDVVAGVRRGGALWVLLRLGVDCVCVLAALFLVLLRQEDTFRLYCRKAGKQ